MNGLEKLERLVVVLKNVQPSTFKMSSWKCGTTACAVGHGSMDPVLSSLGLGLGLTRDFPEDLPEPTYGNFAGWEAVRTFFELDCTEARFLFCYYQYKRNTATRKNVIERIEGFITCKRALERDRLIAEADAAK